MPDILLQLYAKSDSFSVFWTIWWGEKKSQITYILFTLTSATMQTVWTHQPTKL